MPRLAPLLGLNILGGAALAQPRAAQPAGMFTAEQSQSGRAIYTRICSGCHGSDFEGSGDAPSLAGGTFIIKWRSRMVSELFGEDSPDHAGG